MKNVKILINNLKYKLTIYKKIYIDIKKISNRSLMILDYF